MIAVKAYHYSSYSFYQSKKSSWRRFHRKNSSKIIFLKILISTFHDALQKCDQKIKLFKEIDDIKIRFTDKIFTNQKNSRIIVKIFKNFKNEYLLTFQQLINLLKRIQSIQDQDCRSKRPLDFFLGTIYGTKLTSLYFLTSIVGQGSLSFSSYV